MKKILTDVDGCLLLWEKAFHEWMAYRGEYERTHAPVRNIHEMYKNLTREAGYAALIEFANCSWIGFLEPERDAVQGVQELVQQGYVFDVITSLSLDPYTGKLRTMNLNNVFGEECFDQAIYLDTNGDKVEALRPYAGTGYYWIEDKPRNAEAGLEFGLRPILIDHPHNQWYNNPKVRRVSNWREIVDIILQDKTFK